MAQLHCTFPVATHISHTYFVHASSHSFFFKFFMLFCLLFVCLSTLSVTRQTGRRFYRVSFLLLSHGSDSAAAVTRGIRLRQLNWTLKLGKGCGGCDVSRFPSNTGSRRPTSVTQQRVPRTLRASLSGTFLQTLPDLVTPLKGHSLSPRN